MIILVWLLATLQISTVFASQTMLEPQKVVYAIDCGASSSYISSDGFTYKSDTIFPPKTRTVDYRYDDRSMNSNIKLTDDDLIYKSERNSDNSFIYYIPVNKPGYYVLILQFAELLLTKSGARVFNVKLGDSLAVEGIDIYAQVGNSAAYDVYIEFELKDDEIFYQGHVCSNAFKFKEKKLIVEFEKTDRGLPKIDGLILYKGKLEDTNYEFIKKRRDERKKELETIKANSSDKKIADEKDSEYVEDLFVKPQGNQISVLKLLFSGPGLIVSVLVLIIVLIYFNVNPDYNSTMRKKKKKKENKKNN